MKQGMGMQRQAVKKVLPIKVTEWSIVIYYGAYMRRKDRFRAVVLHCLQWWIHSSATHTYKIG